MRLTAATRISVSLLLVLLQPFLVLWYLQFFFENPPQAEMPFSMVRWRLMERAFTVESAAVYVFATTWLTAFVCLVLGILRGRTWQRAVDGVGGANAWLLLLAVHILLTYLANSHSAQLAQHVAFWTPSILAAALAGWLAGHWQAASSSTPGGWARAWTSTVLAAVVYATVFSTLSILQYEALHVPHGDSGMYEEHLWNFAQGKGFRSQLDDGRLFLGEHFQIIHLFLLPVYLLAPTMPTLMICQSAALASGSLAVTWLCRQKDFPPRAAFTLALAYLLYFPLHYLNIEITWKCLRPTTFGVPLLLFAVAALEAGRYRLLCVLLMFSLFVKEEYAIAAGAIGLFLAFRSLRRPEARTDGKVGMAIACVSGAFLLCALWVLIPYFRGGEPHYAPYFNQLREDPTKAWSLLATEKNARFLVLMLLPFGATPLLSPGRFAVTWPLFLYLMLGDPNRRLAEPYLHFHAPLIPLLAWAAVGGIERLGRRIELTYACRVVACIALVTAFWYGKSPLSWRFHDPLEGMPRRQQGPHLTWEPMGTYWRDVYVPSERATQSFPQVLKTLTPDDRVAATDYIRTRFTHFRAAHDYPTLRGHVTIDDIDAIVLDQTEGWWGRGPTNPDQDLLACMNDPSCGVGTRLTVRGRPFVVAFHDQYFLVVRRVREE